MTYPLSNEVRIVQFAWAKLSSELVHHPFRVKDISPASKLYKNCQRIAVFCAEKGITALEYMLAIHALYGISWIRRVFKTPYLPFAIAVSENNLTKAHGIFLNEVDAKLDLKTEIKNYLILLEGIEPKAAIELVKGGFCGLNPALQKKLISELAHGDFRRGFSKGSSL